MKKRYAILRASVDPGAESTKNRKPAKALTTSEKRDGRAKPLDRGIDASIIRTPKEDSLFLRDGWLSTSTGSSIAVRALQQEEGLCTRHGKN
jgi:hypothetical protein